MVINMKKKILSLFFCVAMVMSLSAGLGITVAATEASTEVTNITGLQHAVNEGGEVKLGNDIDLTTTITVPTGKTVTLDLNGHVLNAGNIATSNPTSNLKSVIYNQGTLTIKDSNPEAAHEQTGLTGITGGVLTGGKGYDNYGGGIYNTGTLNMTGGTIYGNTASYMGGGVYNVGTFTVTGGVICGNTAGNFGGGVGNVGTFTMTGGAISGNTVTNGYGGGVLAGITGTFTVGGTARIVDNTAGGATSNVHEQNSGSIALVTISSDIPLATGASIGISFYSASFPYKLSTNGKANDVKYFFSDASENYHIAYNETGYLEMLKGAASFNVTFDVQGHGTAPDTQTVNSGEKVQKPADPTANGYTFGGWYKEAACTNAWTFETDTVTANTTLYAKWTATLTVPTAADFSYSSTTGTIAAAGEKNLGTVTTYYKVNDTWTTTKPTTAGTYEVGVVTTGGETYAEIGSAAKPFTDSSWTYTVSSKKKHSSSSAKVTYTVTAPSSVKNGSVTVSPKSSTAGETVTLTVTPDKGYTLETLTVTDENDGEVALTKVDDTTYTFTMPNGNVTVAETFKAVETETETETESVDFVDISESDYFCDAVEWAAKNGITSGTDSTHFAPSAITTRAQMVTFLYRAAGSPDVTVSDKFADVDEDSYYAKAVAWAVENGIALGTSETEFSPDAVCTRAHGVTFLFRAAKVSTSGEPEFSDVAADAYYAEAVKWATDNDITNGIGDGMFGSDNDCTRGQIVTFLYRAYANK